MEVLLAELCRAKINRRQARLAYCDAPQSLVRSLNKFNEFQFGDDPFGLAGRLLSAAPAVVVVSASKAAQVVHLPELPKKLCNENQSVILLLYIACDPLRFRLFYFC
jgi:hypothetical protein